MFEILKAEAQLLWRSPIAVEMEDALDGYNATIYTVARLCFVNKIRRESRKRNGGEGGAHLFLLFFFFFSYRVSILGVSSSKGEESLLPWRKRGISVADLETINHRGGGGKSISVA